MYIGGYWGTSNSKEENGKVNYSLNVGYKTTFDALENINLVAGEKFEVEVLLSDVEGD